MLFSIKQASSNYNTLYFFNFCRILFFTPFYSLHATFLDILQPLQPSSSTLPTFLESPLTSSAFLENPFTSATFLENPTISPTFIENPLTYRTFLENPPQQIKPYQLPPLPCEPLYPSHPLFLKTYNIYSLESWNQSLVLLMAEIF